ncbi:hypothetical protein GCM10020229_15600 [Kitasatospora albolonga]|uniref:hypothetical protein n=1 Tax=Kitasatospora albolonga TaxID=68173 RepID=UPI0031EC5299
MTLLASGPFETRRLLGQAGPDAARTVLACVNHAGETVVSGPLPDLEAAERRAAAMGVPYQRLRLPFMSTIRPGRGGRPRSSGTRGSLRWEPPRRPVFSAWPDASTTRATDLPKALAHCLVKAFSLPTVLPSGLNGAALAVEMGDRAALASAVRAVTTGGTGARAARGGTLARALQRSDSASDAASGAPSGTEGDCGGGHGPRLRGALDARRAPARAAHVARPHRPPSSSVGRKP